MSASVRIGTAVLAGYVLGRFKKLRLALVVGSALSNSDVRSKVAELLQKGTGGMLSGPMATQITEQLGSTVTEAVKGAAVSAAGRQMNKVSDRLADRSASLRGDPDREDEVEQRPRPARASRRPQPTASRGRPAAKRHASRST